MKDANKKILLIMWALVVVFLIVILATRKVTHVDGWRDSGNDISINIGLSSNTVIPAASEDFNKVYTFTETDCSNFEIALVSADVILEPADGSEIVVAVNGDGWHKENEPIVSLDRKTLSVNSPKNAEKNRTYLGNRMVTVKVPAALLTTFFDADIQTVSGTIVTHGILYDSFSAQSVSGTIDVTGSFKSIECETVSGDVIIEATDPLSGKSGFCSVSGNIRLRLPSNSSFNMEWETLSGSVTNEFVTGKSKKTGSCSVGTGLPEIDMETVSGNITVNKY